VSDLTETRPPEVPEPTTTEGALEAGPSSGWALVRLAIVLAVLVGVFLGFGLGNLLLVIAVLVAMVMLHELGHLATAKWTGMKATEYFLGFGPRLWSIRRGETEYGIKAIPAGGYVRIIGMSSMEEIDPGDEPRAYRNQPFWARIVVASAGSAMHFLLAFVLAFIALSMIGRPDPSVVTVNSYLSVDGGATTPAQASGIKPGDRIVAVDGRTVTSPDVLSGVVHTSAGRSVRVTVERHGATRTFEVVPVDGRNVSVAGAPLAPKDGPPTGYLGVSLGEGTSTVNPLAAIPDSLGVVRSATTAAFGGIAHLFSPSGLSHYAHQVVHPSSPSSSASAQQQADQSRPESIIGAVRTATQGAQRGALTLLEVLISINIFIGIINMLPMLPLDGGHVAIALYERVRTRRGRPHYQADVTKMMPVVYAFVAFLLLLVSTSVYLDLTHPVANPFK
jgi:membrane-associated protease RseP (regulator of RpoE activity)